MAASRTQSCRELTFKQLILQTLTRLSLQASLSLLMYRMRQGKLSRGAVRNRMREAKGKGRVASDLQAWMWTTPGLSRSA
eukprot:3474638-Amphidinium_carterae.1